MLDDAKKILVISNMYPSVSDPYYGTFVKVFYEYLSRISGYNVSLIAIKGRRNSVVNKIIAYIKFYASILFVVSLKNTILFMFIQLLILLPFENSFNVQEIENNI